MISGCVLVKNESNLLDRCLNSLINFVQEIIVVDNGSTDDSKKIAEKYGAKVIEFTEGFQDQGRNLYMEAASEPWILVLDADEEVLAKDGREILKYLQEAPENCMGVRIPRFDYLGGGKWAFVPFLRLIKNLKTIKYTDRSIHASPGHSIRENGGEVLYSYNFYIQHYDILIKKRTSNKREKYLKQIVDELTSGKGTIDLYLFLGLEYTSIEIFGKLLLSQYYILVGNIEAAEPLAKMLPNLIPTDKTFLYDYVFVVLAEIALRRNNINEALTYCLSSLKMNNNIPHIHINIASLIVESNPEQALTHLNKAIELNPLLLDPLIYKKGEKPNVFELQTSFLSSTKIIHLHYIDCYNMLGQNDQSSIWKQKFNDIISEI
jgi:glycosyltransferase involved in cell wall biosynthesis